MTSLVATADATNAKVDLVLDWAVGDVTIVRTDPDGTRVTVIGTEPATVTGGAWVGVDHTAPLDLAVTYEASSGDDIAVLVSNTVTVAGDGSMWLKHPTLHALNTRISLAETPERDRRLNVNVMAVLGREYPLAISDGRRNAPTAEMVMRTETLAEAANMRALLADGSPLLLMAPDGWDVGTVWIQPTETKEKWLIRYMADPRRVWTVGYATVGRPAALDLTGIIGDWDGLVAAYATWNDVGFANGSWDDLMAN